MLFKEHHINKYCFHTLNVKSTGNHRDEKFSDMVKSEGDYVVVTPQTWKLLLLTIPLNCYIYHF